VSPQSVNAAVRVNPLYGIKVRHIQTCVPWIAERGNHFPHAWLIEDRKSREATRLIRENKLETPTSLVRINSCAETEAEIRNFCLVLVVRADHLAGRGEMRQ
jgi:hypothetical protein